MSQFIPRDSLDILQSYNHPKYVGGQGQGVYIILDSRGKLHWCPSGNNLKSMYQRNPEKYLTGPIWLPLSVEDYNRFHDEFDRQVNNF
jgi:hypothetical protein